MIRMWINGIEKEKLFFDKGWLQRSLGTSKIYFDYKIGTAESSWSSCDPPTPKDQVIGRTWSHQKEFLPQKAELFNTSGCIGVFVLENNQNSQKHGGRIHHKYQGYDWSSSCMDPRLMALWLASKLIRSMSGSLGANPSDFMCCVVFCFGACLFLLGLVDGKES